MNIIKIIWKQNIKIIKIFYDLYKKIDLKINFII